MTTGGGCSARAVAVCSSTMDMGGCAAASRRALSSLQATAGGRRAVEYIENNFTRGKLHGRYLCVFWRLAILGGYALEEIN